MNAYDLNRYSYRGETALYRMMAPSGHAPGATSNALLSNMFGSPLLAANGTAILRDASGQPARDLTGEPIKASDYAGAFNPGPLSLNYDQSGSSPLSIVQTFPGAEQALVAYPDPFNATGPSQILLPWVPNQPGSGFYVASVGNSTLDYFIQSSSIDFTGISTSALVDYNLVPAPTATDPNAMGMEVMAVESENFLGDVFMCYEPAANPPLLAVRMYTPTQAVLNWLNSVPQSYADCGIVVRWSPYDNYVNLIESTTNGVRLQVTQGGGLGRVIGAQLYVPNLPFEE
jgi:hypothetical protein